MQRYITRLALAALAALALAMTRPAAADGYTVTDLGALPGKPYSSTWQQAINNNGEIAAYANSSVSDLVNETYFGDASFLWKNGVIAPLPGLPNSFDTIAFSLNNKGQAVGRSTPDGERNHAVLWDHGVIQLLGELPGDNKSAALQINDRGQAVGYSQKPVADGNDRRAALWYKGAVSRLPSLPGGGGYDEGLGVNEQGQIAGFSGQSYGLEHIAVWEKGAVTDLGTLGGDWGDGYAINNKGQIAGASATASGDEHAFLGEKGILIDLGVADGDVFSAALSINIQGQVVGYSGSDPDDITKDHALLWANGVMTDLQTKIPAGSGLTIIMALGINDGGQIVAQGILNGTLRAVLLTPVN